MSLVDKVKDVAKWTVPVLKQPNLEEQLTKAKGYDDIRNVLAQARSKQEYDSLEARLRQHIEGVNYENRNLYRFAKLVDTYDKALVPVDVVADYMKIMGGVGYGISAAKELVEAPVKAAYSAYYLGKTKDLKGFLYNIVYEGLSFFVPGSLLDLTNHYVKQAEKYTVKTAVKRFIEEVKKPQEVRSITEERAVVPSPLEKVAVKKAA